MAQHTEYLKSNIFTVAILSRLGFYIWILFFLGGGGGGEEGMGVHYSSFCRVGRICFQGGHSYTEPFHMALHTKY